MKTDLEVLGVPAPTTLRGDEGGRRWVLGGEVTPRGGGSQATRVSCSHSVLSKGPALCCGDRATQAVTLRTRCPLGRAVTHLPPAPAPPDKWPFSRCENWWLRARSPGQCLGAASPRSGLCQDRVPSATIGLGQCPCHRAGGPSQQFHVTFVGTWW